MPRKTVLPFPYIEFGPYLEGVNYRDAATRLGPSQVYSMKNCEIAQDGSLVKRNGFTEHIDGDLSGDPTIQGCGQSIFSPSSDQIWVVAGDKFYTSNGSAWTNRTGGATITDGDDNIVDWAMLGDLLAITNNVDAPLSQADASSNIAAADVDSRFTKAKCVEYWDNRAWWANLEVGGNRFSWRVWYSNPLDPAAYDATDFKNILNGQGEITGLIDMGDFLGVHYNNDLKSGIVAIMPQGIASIPYTEPRSLARKGTIAPRSIKNLSNGTQVFARKDGIYEWTVGNQPTKISGPLDGERYWDNINQNRMQYAHAVDYEDRNQYWIWLPYGSSQQNPNHVMVWDYANRRWFGPMVYTRCSSAMIDRKPFAGGYDLGQLFEHDNGTNDNGSGIDWWAYTGALTPEEGISKYRWLAAQHEYKVTGAHQINVVQISPKEASVASSFEAGGSFDAIGVDFAVGVSKIGGAGIVDRELTQLKGYDSHVQLFFANANADEACEVRESLAFFKV